MRTKRKAIHLVLPLFIIAPIISAARCSTDRGNEQSKAKDAVPYTIIYDRMDTKIKIGVPASITAKQLRATLASAVNDHQDDDARDYIMLCCLWVEAYLTQDGKQSGVPAGTLRRQVPWANPAERRKIATDRSKDDSVIITLDEAKKTIK